MRSQLPLDMAFLHRCDACVTDFLACNEIQFAQRWPELWAQVGETPLPPYELRKVREGTVQVRGIQLASAFDSREEARMQASRLPERAPEIHVYGLGLGALPRAVLEREDLRSLRIVLLGLGTTKVALSVCDHSDWLADPRVTFIYGGDLRGANVGEPFVVVPPELQLADDACLALRDAIASKLDQPFAERKWREREEAVAGHIAQNRALVATDGDVREHFGRHAGAEVVVVGPGPTLAEHLPRLIARRGTSPLVAISTALIPLLEAGVVPDYVVMIDSHSIDPVPPSWRGSMERVSLVYAPEVQPATLRAWPGPRLAAYLDRPRYSDLNAEFPRAKLWSSGTVTHFAVDLAVQLGAGTITMFGLDFANPGGESHAPGTPDYQAQQRTAPGRSLLDGYGRRVASEANLIAYLRDLEEYVRAHPSVAFRRVGRRGAQLEGVSWLDD